MMECDMLDFELDLAPLTPMGPEMENSDTLIWPPVSPLEISPPSSPVSPLDISPPSSPVSPLQSPSPSFMESMVKPFFLPISPISSPVDKSLLRPISPQVEQPVHKPIATVMPSSSSVDKPSFRPPVDKKKLKSVIVNEAPNRIWSRMPMKRTTKAPERQITAPERQTTAPERQTTGSKRQTTAPKRQTTAPKRQTTTPKRQTTAPERQTTGPKRQTTAHERQTTAPEKQTTGPKRQTTGPKRQTTAPKRQTTAPERQTTAPERQTTAPERQTTAPERQTTASVPHTTVSKPTVSQAYSSYSSAPTRHQKFRPFHLKRPYGRRVHMHEKVSGVLCIQDNGYSLTNGVKTISWDGKVDQQLLLEDVIYTNIRHTLTVDENTNKTWKSIVEKLDTMHPIKDLKVMKLIVKQPLGQCSFCTKQCHRYKVVTGGFSQISHVPLDIIQH
nr:zonadhesin-like [Parasteatoda tepidariorum]